MGRLLAAGLLATALAGCNLLGAPPTPTPTPARTTAPTPAPTPTPTATPAPTPSPTPAPTLSPAPTGYTSPRGSITVDQPRGFAQVTSPFTASGTASLFEAAFSWRLVDLSGKALAAGNGQASEGAPGRGTYTFNVTFTVTTDTYGYLEVFSQNARDGSVDDMARVPLVLAVR